MGLITAIGRAFATGILGDSGWFNNWNTRSFNDTMGQFNVSADNRQAFLDDRAHTEMREDTAYQRAVADMKAAGLNPLALGGVNPAASSPSTANADNFASKIQLIGSMLQLENLNSKNKKLANDELTKAFDYLDRGEQQAFSIASRG